MSPSTWPPGADFSSLQRVSFVDGVTAGPALHEEPLDRRVARQALRARLERDGYRFADPADFRVRFQVGSLQHVPAEAEYRIAGGLRVEILGATGERVLFRGWAGETVDDRMDPESEIRAAVDLLMDRFPAARAMRAGTRCPRRSHLEMAPTAPPACHWVGHVR